jgi:Uncharacterised nucleotidyltransferase
MRKSYRPILEQRLILLSAGTTARRQATRAQSEELGGLVDWSLVAELLYSRRLLPLLGPRLLELAEGHADEGLAPRVAQALDAGRRRGVLLQLITERLMTALSGAGIRCTALKGPVLSQTLYGEPGRRPSADIDLLMAPEQLRDAIEVVREWGYCAPHDHVDEHGLPRLHFALVHEHGQLPPVELHWRIHWYERSFAVERLLAPNSDLGDAWRPAPIDEFTALLLFYARDGFIDLRHATDLGAHWDTFGSSLQPGALDELIRAYPALEHVILAAATVAERTVGIPLDRLTEHGAKLGRRGRLAVRLANPHPYGSRPQLYADMGLIDGLLAPPGGFRAFIKRQVVPPREVLHERAQKERRQAGSTLGHSVRVLARYGLSMTRLLCAPATGRPR